MRYKAELLVPAATPQSSPVEEELTLIYGTVTEIEVIIPPGQAGLVNLAIYHGQHQLYPTSPGQSFRGDDTHITISDRYELAEEPFAFRLVGFAPTTTLDHTILVEVTVAVKLAPVLILELPADLPPGFYPEEVI